MIGSRLPLSHFNADGSEVQQCGNGARCFARFVRLKGLTNKDRIAVSTVSGRIVLQLEDNDQVTVNMGVPEFEPAKVPFRALKAEKLYLLRVAEQTVMCGAVSMGNPHCVLEVPNVKTAPVETLGPKLESFDRFPERSMLVLWKWFRRTKSTCASLNVAPVKHWLVVRVPVPRWSTVFNKRSCRAGESQSARRFAVYCVEWPRYAGVYDRPG